MQLSNETIMIEANYGIAEMAKDAVCRNAQGKIVAGDLTHGQNVEHGGVEQEIDPHDGEDAAEYGARHVAARIFHFRAEIDDAIPAVNRVNHRLQRDEE